MRYNKDLRVYQYLEIARLLKYFDVDFGKVEAIVKQYHLEQPVYYVFYYILKLFPDLRLKLEKMLDNVEPEDTKYLEVFGAENEKDLNSQFLLKK